MTQTLEGITEEDGKFLKTLNAKCNEIAEEQFEKSPISRTYYKNIKLSVSEVERILSIVENRGNVLLMPIGGEFGFHPAFQVLYFEDTAPGIEKFEHKPILRFDRDQLPQGYDFARLAEHFTSQGNLQKARFAGVEFEVEEHHYTY